MRKKEEDNFFDYDSEDDYNDIYSYDDDDIDDYSYDYKNYQEENYQYKDIDTSYQDEDNEDYENKSSIKNKLLKVILIIFIITLVIWLIRLRTNNNKQNKTNSKDNEVTVIKNKEVNNNKTFEKMKLATLKYYDKKRLSDNKNDNTVTLNKLKTLKLINNIDSMYDINKTKSELKKNEDTYTLKITLSFDNKTLTKEYIVSNYNHCKETYLCENEQNNSNDPLMNKEDKYLYEYVKNGIGVSNWSSWSKEQPTACTNKNIICKDNNCLQETKIIQRNNKIGTYNKIYENNRLAFSTNGKEIKKVCRNYDYIKINNRYYRTENNSKYKVLGAIKKETQSDYYNWKYLGRKLFNTPPNDTINTRNVFVSADYTNCGSTCTNGPKYYYDVYQFTKQLNETTSPETDCQDLILKGIADYSIKNQLIRVGRIEEKYNTSCYKISRVRKKEEQQDTKWSTKNDSNLLNNGYKLTGNKKRK